MSRHSTRMCADFHAVDLCFCKFPDCRLIFLQMARHSPGSSKHFQAADLYFHKWPGTHQAFPQASTANSLQNCIITVVRS
jgi:hypothetical protein